MDQESETQNAQIFEEAQSQDSFGSVDQEQVVVRTIRYMDNDTFRRSLNRVVVAHDRLLAKLAE